MYAPLLPSIHPFFHPSIHPSIPTYLPACMHACIHTYIHTYRQTDIHTYIPTYIHANMHTYKHTYIHTYIPTYLHTYIPTYLHTCIPTYLHSYIHSYIQTYRQTDMWTYIPYLILICFIFLFAQRILILTKISPLPSHREMFRARQWTLIPITSTLQPGNWMANLSIWEVPKVSVYYKVNPMIFLVVEDRSCWWFVRFRDHDGKRKRPNCWCFQMFVIFTPILENNDPLWLIFFNWVGSTTT